MRKSIFLLILLSWFNFGCGNGQQNPQKITASNTNSNNKNITIVNWNIEWFGSAKNGPYDLDLQQENVRKVLLYLHADLFGLCEVVDVDRFEKVVRALGDQYSFVVSDYAASVKNRNSSGWNDAQKMAFVYDKNVFKNVRVRAFMQQSGRAGYNFSNGRYPFLLEANMSQNGKTIPIAVLLIHAKSGADNNSYTRRLQAANELTDSIRIVWKEKPLMIMGDYNDVLQSSISGKNLISPYNILLQKGNVALTLKLSAASGGSTLHYPTVIDNQIVNSALMQYYVNGSIAIRKDIVNVVNDFKNGKTSDHYPISADFDLQKSMTTNIKNDDVVATETINKTSNTSATNSADFVQIVSPGFQDAIKIRVSERQDNVQFVLYNNSNEKVLSVLRRSIEPRQSFFLRCKELPSGDYTLVVFKDGNKNVFKVRKN